MVRRPPRSTLDRSSAASDVYKRQIVDHDDLVPPLAVVGEDVLQRAQVTQVGHGRAQLLLQLADERVGACLLYTSDAADERSSVDLGGRRIIKTKTDANVADACRRITPQKRPTENNATHTTQ